MNNSNKTAESFQIETVENDLVKLIPLETDDFERVYAVASDALIWEQHPSNDRWKRDVFEKFFDEALKSKRAFIILDAKTNEPIGSSRFYDYDAEKGFAAIGYTFLARDHWGGNYNRAMKNLMLDFAFRFVDTVIFHVASINLRSQKAIEKLGAKRLSDAEAEFYGEAVEDRWVYILKKKDWGK